MLSRVSIVGVLLMAFLMFGGSLAGAFFPSNGYPVSTSVTADELASILGLHIVKFPVNLKADKTVRIWLALYRCDEPENPYTLEEKLAALGPVEPVKRVSLGAVIPSSDKRSDMLMALSWNADAMLGEGDTILLSWSLSDNGTKSSFNKKVDLREYLLDDPSGFGYIPPSRVDLKPGHSERIAILPTGGVLYGETYEMDIRVLARAYPQVIVVYLSMEK